MTRKVKVAVRHGVISGWTTSLCGKAIKSDLNYTTVRTSVTCKACKDSQRLLDELEHATPDDFEESK